MTQAPISPQTASDVASLFETLSDPTRVRIIAVLLDGEIGFGELVARIGITPSAVSHQLRLLRDRRLVCTRKQGRNLFIVISDEHIKELFQRGLEHILYG